MTALTRSNALMYVLVGAGGYTALRTSVAFAAQRHAILLASLLSLTTTAWVITLLVLAVKRRHRTQTQATVDVTLAIGLGYFSCVVTTTPFRVQLDPTQTLRAILPLLFGVTLGAMFGAFLVAAVIVAFARRKDPKPIPPASATELDGGMTP